MKREVKVGLLVITAFIVLGIGVFLVSERRNLFSLKNDYFVELETGRRMTGQEARREVVEQMVTITGSPVRLSDPSGNVVSGSSLTWNQADGTVSVAGGTETIYYPEEKP